jgi:hypothetical protein
MHFLGALQLEQQKGNAYMTTSVLPFGTEIASELRGPSANGASTPGTPRTLGDLLARWAEHPPREWKMLRTTCARLADYLETPVEEVSIDAVAQSRNGFRSFLEGRKYGENSIRTYVNLARILLANAEAAGWSLKDATSKEWLTVLNFADDRKCMRLVRHLSTARRTPHEVTIEDVNQWVHEVSQQQLSYGSAVEQRTDFWRIIRDLGYPNKLPASTLRESNYGIPIDEFPDGLKREVLNLLKWKQAAYAMDRPKGARHRPETAKRLRQVICALYGYAVHVRRETEIKSFSLLVQKPIIGGFIEWCINEREVKGQTLQRNLRLLAAVFNQHSAYSSEDRTWFKPLLDGIPIEPESVTKKRKVEKYLDYATLEDVPQKIRAGRTSAGKKSRKQLALVVRDELLVKWLTVLPWRQRNLRECRIGGSSPNLYKGPVPAMTDIEMPEWAIAEQRQNSNATFWQFHFTEDETKTGCEVHALLPRQLITLLEEYVHEFRSELRMGVDPETLFLNRKGKPMALKTVTDLVSQLTLRHGGRRVTPHLFRDIVAYTWLKHHPKDYLTLSKHLWHASPNEVIKTYGSRFNESSGVCMMEAWLDERAMKG